MEVKLFKCAFNDLNQVFHKEYIFATDESMARTIIRDKYGLRKNSRGLMVIELAIVYAERVYKPKRILVNAREEIIDCSYCSNCGKQVMPSGDFCDNCGAYFMKKERKPK